MWRIVFVIMAAIFACSPAQAEVSTSAVCESDTMVITVSFQYADALQLRDLNIETTLVGSCESARLLTDEAVAVQVTDDVQTIVFKTVPEFRDRIYRYQTVFTNVNGDRVAGGDLGCSYFAAYGVCGEGLASRGRFIDYGLGRQFQSCEGGCWIALSSSIDWGVVGSELDQYVNTGQVVSIYGDPGPASWPPCHMPGTPALRVTRIEPVNDPDGCDALSTGEINWGSLKSLYR